MMRAGKDGAVVKQNLLREEILINMISKIIHLYDLIIICVSREDERGDVRGEVGRVRGYRLPAPRLSILTIIVIIFVLDILIIIIIVILVRLIIIIIIASQLQGSPS